MNTPICSFCPDFENQHWEFEQEECDLGDFPELQFKTIIDESLLPIANNYYTATIYRGTTIYSFPTRQILKCPRCSVYYLYRVYIPGGSNDAMRTYLCEEVRKLKSEETVEELKSFIREYKANLPYNLKNKEFLAKQKDCENSAYAEVSIIETGKSK